MVDIKSDIRYQLVDERDILKETGSEAFSSTKEIKSYYIRDHGRGIKMQVIDTPGFKSTFGIAKDSDTTQMLKKFFEYEID